MWNFLLIKIDRIKNNNNLLEVVTRRKNFISFCLSKCFKQQNNMFLFNNNNNKERKSSFFFDKFRACFKVLKLNKHFIRWQQFQNNNNNNTTITTIKSIKPLLCNRNLSIWNVYWKKIHISSLFFSITKNNDETHQLNYICIFSNKRLFNVIIVKKNKSKLLLIEFKEK